MKRSSEEVTTDGSFETNSNLLMPKPSYRNLNLRRGACLDGFDYDSGPIDLPTWEGIK